MLKKNSYVNKGDLICAVENENIPLQIKEAESGIMNDDDVAYLKEVGVDGFLIGRAFMEAPNPGELSRRWKEI